MNILIISTSLKPTSRSRILAELVHADLDEMDEVETGHLSLTEFPLPFCDGGAAYGDGMARELAEQVKNADAVVFATPIYNYDVNSAAKNVVELAGQNFSGKVVAFLCAAGGQGSYMSVMAFANSLMLDFRTIVLPRFVYVTGADFDEEDGVSDEVAKRLQQFAEELVKLTRGVHGE